MIRISKPVVGARKPSPGGNAKNNVTGNIRAHGMLGTRYRFWLEVERCSAAMRAMSCIPCDASLRVVIDKGTITLEGYIENLIEEAFDPARLAIASLEAAAKTAAATSSGSRAELRFTQTWDWL
jgi:hypothetical protein